MRVEVLPYDPQWALSFQQIKSSLEDTLTGIPYLSIEHVGSTSVPGLYAKPIVDIDIVATPAQLDAISSALVSRAGYENMGEWGVADRVTFRKEGAEPRRNLYVVLEGCVALRNHLALREACSRDVEVREMYGRRKMELAGREWKNVDEYAFAKNEIVQWVLRKAGLTEEELREIARHNE